jgi:hypothetical protein
MRYDADRLCFCVVTRIRWWWARKSLSRVSLIWLPYMLLSNLKPCLLYMMRPLTVRVAPRVTLLGQADVTMLILTTYEPPALIRGRWPMGSKADKVNPVYPRRSRTRSRASLGRYES